MFVATQDPDLTRTLRNIPGVPLLRLDGPVPRIEEPSNASRGEKAAAEDKKTKASDWEKAKLPKLREKEAEAKAKAEAGPKKRRGPKGANPLSCKKSKGKDKSKQPASSAGVAGGAGQSADAGAVAPKAKRQRSRRMGTRKPELGADDEQQQRQEQQQQKAGQLAAPTSGVVSSLGEDRPRKRQRSRRKPGDAAE